MAKEPHRLTPNPDITEQRPKPPPPAAPPPEPVQQPARPGTREEPTQMLAYTVTVECPTWKAQITCDHIPVPNELIVVTKPPTPPPGQGVKRDMVLTVIRVCHQTELNSGFTSGTVAGIVIKCNPYMGFV